MSLDRHAQLRIEDGIRTSNHRIDLIGTITLALAY